MLKKQKGEVYFFGKPIKELREDFLKEVGSMIETPSVYGHLTATDNLRVWAKMYNTPMDRIDKVLSIVGLSHTGNKKASMFSLGMKQRLGIAIALLHEPRVLILDEPTNGLDPNGIIEIRELLKKMNREQGITILISSHILSEIEKLVTHLGIISNGVMKFQGTLSDLEQKQNKGVLIRTTNNKEAITILRDLQFPVSFMEDDIVFVTNERKEVAEAISQLALASVGVYSVEWGASTLEDIFMELIN